MVLLSTPGHCQSLESLGKRAQEPVPNSHPKKPHTVSPGHPQFQSSRPSYPRVSVSATQAWGGSRLKVFGEAQLAHRPKWQCT